MAIEEPRLIEPITVGPGHERFWTRPAGSTLGATAAE